MNEKKEHLDEIAYLNEVKEFTLRYFRHWFTKFLSETSDRIPGANCSEKAATKG